MVLIKYGYKSLLAIDNTGYSIYDDLGEHLVTYNWDSYQPGNMLAFIDSGKIFALSETNLFLFIDPLLEKYLVYPQKSNLGGLYDITTENGTAFLSCENGIFYLQNEQFVKHKFINTHKGGCIEIINGKLFFYGKTAWDTHAIYCLENGNESLLCTIPEKAHCSKKGKNGKLILFCDNTIFKLDTDSLVLDTIKGYSPTYDDGFCSNSVMHTLQRNSSEKSIGIITVMIPEVCDTRIGADILFPEKTNNFSTQNYEAMLLETTK